MLEVLQACAGCAAVLAAAWLLSRRFCTDVDAHTALEQAYWKQMDEELPILKHILNAPDAEYPGMGLAEAMKATRERVKAGQLELP